MTTPIESRIDWAAHRETATAVRSLGGHYACSQSIGFEVTRQPGETLDVWLGKPCERCLALWQQSKQQQRKGKAA